MRFLNWFCRFVLFAGLVAIAALTIMYGRNEIFDQITTWYETTKSALRVPPDLPFRYVIGGVSGVLAAGLFITLIPRGRKDREVTFSGTHGEVSISLEPVEATLNRVVQKLPDVKTIDLKIKPMEDQGKVRVQGTAVLYKDADSDARMITARVCNFISMHTRKIIGVSDIEPKLKVKRWVFRMKTVKPEPLLLEGPEAEEYAQEPPQRSVARSSAEDTTAAYEDEDSTIAEVSWSDDDDLAIEGNRR